MTAVLDAPTLFDVEPLVRPDIPHAATIDERFTAWVAVNGWVVVALERLAGDLVAAGRTRIGVKALVEVIRWDYDRRTTGDCFRVNNSFASRLSRLLIQRNPEWAGLIETRGLRSA